MERSERRSKVMGRLRRVLTRRARTKRAHARSRSAPVPPRESDRGDTTPAGAPMPEGIEGSSGTPRARLVRVPQPRSQDASGPEPGIGWSMSAPPAAHAEVRRLARQLTTAPPSVRRILTRMIEEIERRGEIALPERPPPDSE